MAHTQGPWVYHAKTGTIQPYPGSGYICTIAHRPDMAARDNAALIAAAPDLLAALEYIAPHLGTLPIFEHERVKIREAIARAKGESE